MDDKQRIMQIIEDKSQEFIDAADHIWGTPETRFAVKESVQQHYKVLEQEGFDIEKGVGHMDYAYVATWGSGRPVIGITGEYDALGGLSQVADLGEHKPLVEGGNGQGCGHNILGMAAVAARPGAPPAWLSCRPTSTSPACRPTRLRPQSWAGAPWMPRS